MKKFLLLFLLISIGGFGQTINNYKYVIVPLKFDFLPRENQYRLNTFTKMNLNSLGFTAFYELEEIPQDINKDRCNFLYADVENVKGMLATKVFITFKNCQNKVIYKSEVGTSRVKEFEKAYQEALKAAFVTIQYSYEGNLEIPTSVSIASATETPKHEAPKPVALKPDTKLKAEAISSGYLVIDESSSTIVLRLTKTSDPKTFIAQRQNTPGVLIQKENGWYFEYYLNDAMISEKINVTF